jgi:hypothetical protein
MTTVDYLDEDTILPKEQKYVCLSYLMSEDKKLRGLKIRGSFETYEEACAQAKKLQEVDKYFDVFVGEVGKWLPVNSDAKNEEFGNEQLNNIMKDYKANQEKAKVFYEKQKNEKLVKSLEENLELNKNNKKKLEKKLKSLSGMSRQTALKNIEELNKKMKQISDKATNLRDKIKSVNL